MLDAQKVVEVGGREGVGLTLVYLTTQLRAGLYAWLHP